MITTQYIKKEDAAYFVRQQYKMVGVMYLALAGVYGFIYFTVVPKMMQLYADFTIPLHPSLKISTFIFILASIAFVLIGFKFLGKKVDTSELNKKLRAYKPNEMILSNKVLDMRTAYIALTAGFLLIGLISASIIAPIYSLTESF